MKSSGGWQWATEPPQSLLKGITEQINHETINRGQTASQQQLLEAAAKNLKANEVLFHNPTMIAYMTLDISPLRQGEDAPGKETIRLYDKIEGAYQLMMKNKWSYPADS